MSALSAAAPAIPASTVPDLVVPGAIVLAVYILAGFAKVGFRRARKPGKWWQACLQPLMGADKRVSTSKTVAMLWTLTLAWMVLSLAFVALRSDDPGAYLTASPGPFDHFDTYLLLIGGPFAALVFSKAIIQQKADSGTDQRPSGDEEKLTLRDVFSNAAGDVDVYDFQYTIFNAVALLFVLMTFLHQPAQGLPQVPDQLAILTGGPAAVYLARKIMVQAKLEITAVIPTDQYVGEDVCIYGSGFVADRPDEKATWPTVEIGSRQAEVLNRTDTELRVRVPPLPPNALDTKVTVRVVTKASVPQVTKQDAPTLLVRPARGSSAIPEGKDTSELPVPPAPPAPSEPAPPSPVPTASTVTNGKPLDTDDSWWRPPGPMPQPPMSFPPPTI